MAKYGLPLDGQFDTSTKDKLLSSIARFNECPRNKRLMLSRHLNDELYMYDILVELSPDNEFIKYINKMYLLQSSHNNSNRSPIFVKHIRQIVEVKYEDMAQYNRQIFDNLAKYVLNISDNNLVLDIIKHTNEYANKVIQTKIVGEETEELVLSNLLHICKSLQSIILYTGSLAQVNNLINDIEVLASSGLDYYLIRRNLLQANYMASKKITGCESDIIRVTLKRTGDILANKPSQMSRSKYSSLQLSHTSTKGNDIYINYLLDKKSEYKSFLDIYMNDVVLGFNRTPTIEDDIYANDEYKLFEIKNELDNYAERVHYITKKYPKLTNIISTSELFRIRENLNKKKIMVVSHKDISICIMNNKVHFIMKKKNTNDFYLIDDDTVSRLNYVISDESGEPLMKKHRAIKIKFNDINEDDNLESILESVTSVKPQLGRVKY